MLEQRLISQGEQPSTDRWKSRNFNYLWPSRWLQAVSEIEQFVRPGNSYLLVNNNEWGTDEPVHGRHAIPFVERDGRYWGPPVDDETAIAELDRLRRDTGVSHIVFSWTAFWWFEQYPRFNSWLRSRHRCVLENEALIAFEI